VPLTILGVASLPAAQRPGGTALFNLTRELGASIGTAWMSTMLDRETHRAFTFITSHVTDAAAAANEQLTALQHGPGARLWDPAAGALAVLQQRIAGQALLRAFNHNFLLLALSFACAGWLIILMRRPRPGVAVDAKDAH
jgi:DHA2 family multidrug resistance protein